MLRFLWFALLIWVLEGVRPSFEDEAKEGAMRLGHFNVDGGPVKDLSWDDDDEETVAQVTATDEEDPDGDMMEESPSNYHEVAKEKKDSHIAARGGFVQTGVNQSAARSSVFHREEAADYDEAGPGPDPETIKCKYDDGEFERVQEHYWLDKRPDSRRGWISGAGAWLAQLGSLILGWRVTAIEALTKEQAKEVIELMYGKLIVNVLTKNCFDDITALLLDMDDIENQRAELADLKAARAKLRRIIDNQVRYGCPKEKEPKVETVAGKQAQKELQPLKYGLWVLYKPFTVEGAKQIAASTTDRFRFNKRVFPDRQVWHYGKNHLYNYLSGQIRNELFATHKAYALKKTWPLYRDAHELLDDNTEHLAKYKTWKKQKKAAIKKLKAKLVDVARVLSFGLATLEHAEFERDEDGSDKTYGCINFYAYHTISLAGSFLRPPANNIYAGHPRDFERWPFMGRWYKVDTLVGRGDRVTLMFRERMWKDLGHKFKVVMSPWTWAQGLKKWVDRKSDNWHRLGAWNKVKMVFTPIMKLVTMAGIVMGAVTLGATTITTLVVQVLIDMVGAHATYASGTFLSWIISNVIFQASAPLQGEMYAHLEGTSWANWVYGKLGFTEEVQHVRHLMHTIQEDFLNSDYVSENLLEMFVDPSNEKRVTLAVNDEDFTSPPILRATTRVETPVDPKDQHSQGWDNDEGLTGMIKQYTVLITGQEIESGILVELGRKRDHRQPDYGWLPFATWQGGREDRGTKDLNARHIVCIHTVDQVEVTVDGTVTEIKKPMTGKEVMKVEDGPSSTETDVTLTDDVLQSMRVYDPRSYLLAKHNWMRWKNWLWWAKTYKKKYGFELLEKLVRIEPDYMVDVSDTKKVTCAKALEHVKGAQDLLFHSSDMGARVKEVRRPFRSVWLPTNWYTWKLVVELPTDSDDTESTDDPELLTLEVGTVAAECLLVQDEAAYEEFAGDVMDRFVKVDDVILPKPKRKDGKPEPSHTTKAKTAIEYVTELQKTWGRGNDLASQLLKTQEHFESETSFKTRSSVVEDVYDELTSPWDDLVNQPDGTRKRKSEMHTVLHELTDDVVMDSVLIRDDLHELGPPPPYTPEKDDDTTGTESTVDDDTESTIDDGTSTATEVDTDAPPPYHVAVITEGDTEDDPNLPRYEDLPQELLPTSCREDKLKKLAGIDDCILEDLQDHDDRILGMRPTALTEALAFNTEVVSTLAQRTIGVTDMEVPPDPAISVTWIDQYDQIFKPVPDLWKLELPDFESWHPDLGLDWSRGDDGAIIFHDGIDIDVDEDEVEIAD